MHSGYFCLRYTFFKLITQRTNTDNLTQSQARNSVKFLWWEKLKIPMNGGQNAKICKKPQNFNDFALFSDFHGGHGGQGGQ